MPPRATFSHGTRCERLTVAGESLGLDELQLAVYSRITDATYGIGSQYQDSAGNWKVYDHVPLTAAMPFVEIGGVFAQAGDDRGRRTKPYTISLHCFSAAKGYQEVNELLNALANSLTDPANEMALSGDFQLATSRIASCEVDKEFDESTEEIIRHGVLRIECLVRDASA